MAPSRFNAPSFLHRHNPLGRVVRACTLWTNRAADLKIAPTERAVNAMQYQSHPSRRALHANFHETLKERGSIEVEYSGERFHRGRPGVEALDPPPNRLFPPAGTERRKDGNQAKHQQQPAISAL